MAVLTIGVSLLVSGIFFVAGKNLASVLESWRSEARLIVYLDSTVDAAQRESLTSRIEEARWVAAVREVSPEQAGEAFRRAFPSLNDLLEGWVEGTLPGSLEIELRADASVDTEIAAWIDRLEADPTVDSVDDDRDWMRQLAATSAAVRTTGLILGLVLLAAATFTIASVVRLNAYLHEDEISIMRLVGATEFLIRGPFYCEGLLQGLIGGLAAAGGLYAAYRGLLSVTASEGLLRTVLLREFLTLPELAVLVAVGTVAGLVGAVSSLRGEALSRETS